MAKRSQSLSRRILIALGIPAVFIPGLLLASLLGWDWQAGLAKLARSPKQYYQSTTVFPQQGKVKVVIDGDTLELADGTRVRLFGIDAPELSELWGRDAQKALKELLSNLTTSGVAWAVKSSSNN